MKETPIFEEVFMRLTRQPQFWLKVLIGGLLSFVPIVNIFAFGYLYRFSRRIRQTGQIALPEWENWQGLFHDGLRFAVVWAVYWLLPMLLVWSFAIGLGALGLAAFAYLLCAFVFLVTPVLFAAALYRLQMRSDFKDLLDVALIFRMAFRDWQRFLLPALSFVGTIALLLPLYGFAYFIGFLILTAYSCVRFHALEHRRSA